MHRAPVLLLLALTALSGCTSAPTGVQPVGGFVLDRYLGLWYEIARLDHSFERGLTDVTADYSPRDDGGVDWALGLFHGLPVEVPCLQSLHQKVSCGQSLP